MIYIILALIAIAVVEILIAFDLITMVDEIEEVKSEIFILNDAIDELYKEVFPDDY